MPPLYKAKATEAPSHYPTPGKDAIGYLFDCLDLLIRKAVKETVTENQQQESRVAPPASIGGIEVAQEVTLLSKARIYALVSEQDPQKRLPCAKRGNRLYFDRAELLLWIAEGKRAGRKAA